RPACPRPALPLSRHTMCGWRGHRAPPVRGRAEEARAPPDRADSRVGPMNVLCALRRAAGPLGALAVLALACAPSGRLAARAPAPIHTKVKTTEIGKNVFLE